MNIALVCVLVVLVLIWYEKERKESMKTTRKCNDIDGRCYEVSSKYRDSTLLHASERLAKLNEFAIKLIRHLRHTYLWNQNTDVYKSKMVKFLLHNYDPTNLIENAPKGNINTSYVENKGFVFAMCLREKVSGLNKFIPMHDLEFVVLHEISHLASRGYGHGDEFWVNFKILLQEADKIGIHKPIDYKKYPMVYCSLPVNYNPFFDEDIPNQI